jgi:ABC-type multidrug transport system ATPase subunit
LEFFIECFSYFRPTVGLDPVLRKKLWKFLRQQVKDQKVTVLMTTHYVQEAMNSDFIGYLRNGSILIQNSPDNILSYFKDRFENLNEILLNLCGSGENDCGHLEIEEPSNAEESFKIIEKSMWRSSYSRMKALLYEEFMHFKREPM